MSLVKCIVIGWIVANGLLLVGRVGKEREPVGPATAVFGLVEFGVICWLVVIA